MATHADLMATFGADTSGFEKGADKVQQRATMLEKSLNSVGNRFFSSFIAMFGLNAVMRFGQMIGEDVKTIDQLANRFSMTTDEVQLLQLEAERLGMTFEGLVKETTDINDLLDQLRRKGDQPLYSRNDVETMRTINKELKQYQNDAKVFGVSILQALDPRRFFSGERAKAAIEGMVRAAEQLPGFKQYMKANEPWIGDWEETKQAVGIGRKSKDEMIFEEHLADLRAFEQKSKDAQDLLQAELEESKHIQTAVKNMWDEAEKHEDLIKKDKEDKREKEKRLSDALEKGWKPETTDSLQEIGNFLGTNPRSIEQQSLSSIQRTVEAIFRKLQEPKPPAAQQNVFPK